METKVLYTFDLRTIYIHIAYSSNNKIKKQPDYSNTGTSALPGLLWQRAGSFYPHPFRCTAPTPPPPPPAPGQFRSASAPYRLTYETSPPPAGSNPCWVILVSLGAVPDHIPVALPVLTPLPGQILPRWVIPVNQKHRLEGFQLFPSS